MNMSRNQARIQQGTLKATRQGEDWLVHMTLELRAAAVRRMTHRPRLDPRRSTAVDRRQQIMVRN